MTAPAFKIEKKEWKPKKLHALRKLIDEASGQYRKVLLWGAKHLAPENQAELNRLVDTKADTGFDPKALDGYPNMKLIWSGASVDQRRAIEFMSYQLAPDRIDTLDKLIGLNRKRPEGQKPDIHHHP